MKKLYLYAGKESNPKMTCFLVISHFGGGGSRPRSGPQSLMVESDLSGLAAHAVNPIVLRLRSAQVMEGGVVE